MSAAFNPALAAFVAQLGQESVFAQVLIRRLDSGYELRHVADRLSEAETLRSVALGQLRDWAQFTEAGAFRPLKSAPNLRSGWRALARKDAELDFALHQLYPGAIADWHAAQSPSPPLTHYRDFTLRQTGMYRITHKLDDAQAAEMIRACCHHDFCLKRRLWTVSGLEPDAASEKSAIPCLEPCAVLLEFARSVMRLEQEEKTPLGVSPGDVATLLAGLRSALRYSVEEEVREADFGLPTNSRRVRRLLEKLENYSKQSPSSLPNAGEES